MVLVVGEVVVLLIQLEPVCRVTVATMEVVLDRDQGSEQVEVA
jgi:hypothetical protein